MFKLLEEIKLFIESLTDVSINEVKKINQEALCIYGANSKYVTNTNLVSFEKYFANTYFKGTFSSYI